MPIPTPEKEEKQEDFISRCMTMIKNEYDNNEQALAVCFSAWKDKNKDHDDDNLDNHIIVQRYDLFDLSEMEEKFKKTDEGYLKGQAIITNIGIFPYRNYDNTVRYELRLPEEVLNDDSVNTLKMIPLTNEHPIDRKIDVNNIKEFQVGHLGDNIRKTDQYISNSIIITDKQAIIDVQKGKRALSAGYSLYTENTSGTWLGIHYDMIQRNIRYNHVAIVDKGRAGDAAVMRMDSKNTTYYNIGWNKNNDKEEVIMPDLKKIQIDNVEYEAEKEVIQAYTIEKKRADELHNENTTLKTEIEKLKTDNSTMEADRDNHKDKAEKAEEALKNTNTDEQKINEAVKKRLVILQIAIDAGIEVKDNMSESDIQKAVIMKVSPNANLDGKDTVYIQARFDGAVERIAEMKDENATYSALNFQPGKTTIPSSEKARQDNIEKMKKISRGEEV